MQVIVQREEPKQPKLKQSTLSIFLFSGEAKEKKLHHIAPLVYTRVICEKCLKEKRDFNFQSYVLEIKPFSNHGFCEICGKQSDKLFIVTMRSNTKSGQPKYYKNNGFKTCGECKFYDPLLKRCRIYTKLRFLSPLSTLARSCYYFSEVE
jgi:hypothetical protein